MTSYARKGFHTNYALRLDDAIKFLVLQSFKFNRSLGMEVPPNNGWANLDVELFLMMVNSLSQPFTPRELCSMEATCKSWKETLSQVDQLFWKTLHQKNFGGKKLDTEQSWKIHHLVCFLTPPQFIYQLMQ